MVMKTKRPKLAHKPLSPDLLRKMNAYRREATILSVGRIYLYDNPLLKKPLTIDNPPIFVRAAEGSGIRSILHTDARSASAKPASPGLPDDEGVDCYQARKWAGSAKQEAG